MSQKNYLKINFPREKWKIFCFSNLVIEIMARSAFLSGTRISLQSSLFTSCNNRFYFFIIIFSNLIELSEIKFFNIQITVGSNITEEMNFDDYRLFIHNPYTFFKIMTINNDS